MVNVEREIMLMKIGSDEDTMGVEFEGEGDCWVLALALPRKRRTCAEDVSKDRAVRVTSLIEEDCQ